jgi:hypothetical protein
MSDERISNSSSMRMCGDNRAAVPATFLIPNALNAMAMLTLSASNSIKMKNTKYQPHRQNNVEKSLKIPKGGNQKP